MRVQAAPQIRQIGPVQTVDRLEGLNAIHDDEIDGVIWNRQIPTSVSSLLGAIATDKAVDGRFCVPVGEVGRRIDNLFDEWEVRIGSAQRWFADDIQKLAGQFAQILSVSDILLRVERVCDDACRKFHRDTVRARLICTYSGPGTEYGIAKDGGEPHPIHTVPTGSPILLKGKLWTCSPQQSIRHRSPQIAGTGMSRLVVVINEAPPVDR